jgi:hypothetical protein
MAGAFYGTAEAVPFVKVRFAARLKPCFVEAAA